MQNWSGGAWPGHVTRRPDLIAAGRVAVAGQTAVKAASQVALDAPITIQQVSDEPEYVSRGGHKLAGALAAFGGLVVTGRRCLDAGASTGGFTDVLLPPRRRARGRRRRRVRPACLVAADRRAGDGARPGQRPQPVARRRWPRRRSWSSPTCRSSRWRSYCRPWCAARRRRLISSDGEATVRGRQGPGRRRRRPRSRAPRAPRSRASPRPLPASGSASPASPRARCPARRATSSTSSGFAAARRPWMTRCSGRHGRSRSGPAVNRPATRRHVATAVMLCRAHRPARRHPGRARAGRASSPRRASASGCSSRRRPSLTATAAAGGACLAGGRRRRRDGPGRGRRWHPPAGRRAGPARRGPAARRQSRPRRLPRRGRAGGPVRDGQPAWPRVSTRWRSG